MVKDCIFCKIVSGESPSWKVYEDDLVVAFFDVNPAAEGHILVVPKKHFKDIFDIEDKYIERIASVCKKIALNLRKVFGTKDINLIHGSGKNAQQDVFHFHMHIWPRKAGDKIQLYYKPKLSVRKDFDKILRRITIPKCDKCGKTLKEQDIGARIHHRLKGWFYLCKKCYKNPRKGVKEITPEFIKNLK